MAEGDETLELKFRIFDGTDIDKSVVPRTVSDIKLIHCGKILENEKTLAESRGHTDNPPGEVITMHVVVQPSVVKRNREKNRGEKQNQNACSCIIL